MDKYNRNYILRIEKEDGTTLEVRRPFTVEFDIHRNSLSSANVCQIRVYNLAPNSRKQIRKNQYDFGNLKTISFQAGYGDNLSLAFAGNITQAWSVREGVNMITQIECFDGGYAYVNAVTDQQFPGGTPQKSIIDSIAASMPGTSIGAIGNFPGQISRGNAYSGSSTAILGDLTGGAFFIDNSKVNALNDNECLDSDIPLINASSGLLGTPVLEAQYINLETLFEPSIKVGQLIQLESETDSFFNGRHKVLSIKHRGMISEAVCGSAVTQLGLLPGSFTPIAQAKLG